MKTLTKTGEQAFAKALKMQSLTTVKEARKLAREIASKYALSTVGAKAAYPSVAAEAVAVVKADAIARRAKERKEAKRQRWVHTHQTLIDEIRELIGRTAGYYCSHIEASASLKNTAFKVVQSLGDRYSKRCTWCRRNLDVYITCQKNWKTNVESRGLACVDGMPTLYAKRVRSERGVELFRAVWVAKGRGHNGSKVQGYIARVPFERQLLTAHAETAEKALATVARRREALKLERRLADISKQVLSGEFAHVLVQIRDSLKAGNCESGTQSWVNQYFPGRTSATVGELIKVESSRDRVLAAIMAAIRRQKLTNC